MALGTFAYLVSKVIREKFSEKKPLIILLSVCEILTIIIAGAISITGFDAVNILELLFLIIITLMLSGITASSRIKGKIPEFLGKMSMPMFITHWIIAYATLYLSEYVRVRTCIYYLGTLLFGIIYTLIVTRGKHDKN